MSGGFFDAVRNAHPCKGRIGQMIDGKMIVATFNVCVPGNICGVPCVRLEDGTILEVDDRGKLIPFVERNEQINVDSIDMGANMSRFDYVAYDKASTKQQSEAKDLAIAMAVLINEIGTGRPQSLALTKLEEVYMWIGKAIRDEQIKRNGSAPLQEGMSRE